MENGISEEIVLLMISESDKAREVVTTAELWASEINEVNNTDTEAVVVYDRKLLSELISDNTSD